MSVLLRRAEESDLYAIAQLAEDMTLPEGQAPPEGGFLVLGYSAEDYRRHLEAGALIWVALKEDETVGFVYAELMEDTDDTDMVAAARRIGDGKYAIVKQVGVRPDMQRSGLGARLYQEMFNTLDRRTLLVAVVTEPCNHASLAF